MLHKDREQLITRLDQNQRQLNEMIADNRKVNTYLSALCRTEVDPIRRTAIVSDNISYASQVRNTSTA